LYGVHARALGDGDGDGFGDGAFHSGVNGIGDYSSAGAWVAPSIPGQWSPSHAIRHGRGADGAGARGWRAAIGAHRRNGVTEYTQAGAGWLFANNDTDEFAGLYVGGLLGAGLTFDL
jgi:hypothetical protein